jgi:hypothetical protein
VVRVVSAGFETADPPPSSSPLIFDERSFRVKF